MNTRHKMLLHQRLRTILGLLLAGGGLLLGLTIFLISHSASAATVTEPDISISADSLQLNPGDTLTISVKITNPFTTTLNRVVVRVKYDHTQLNPIGSSFSKNDDWVSDLSSSNIELTFKDIGAGKSRTGKAIFHVNQPVPGNTSVPMHAHVHWYLNNSNGVQIKDATGSVDGANPLIVAPDGVLTNPNVIASIPRVAINPPAGPTGTIFNAYASGFRAGEGIAIWLNIPGGGVADVPHQLAANDNGEVWPQFGSNNLIPGNYGLVVYGKESTQTLVIPFTVTAGAAPSAAPIAAPPAAPNTAPAVPPPTNDYQRQDVPSLQPIFNIEPKSAAAGTLFNAYGRGFQKNEGISIWLNTPTGVMGIDQTFTANENGEVWPGFSTNGLPPGSYSLVIYGRSGGNTLVVPFTIN